MMRQKKWVGWVVGLMLLTAAACSGPQSEATIEGMIYRLDGSQILVVSGIDSPDIPYDEWFESGEHAAIFFTIQATTRILLEGRYGGLQDLAVGTRVRVWADNGIAKSYPGQAGAARVEVMPMGD